MAVQTIQQVNLDIKEDVAARLFAIPSATTPMERQLTMHYLATQWDGRGDVFENGPLLGGATRALGMGMLYNPNLDPKSLLHTYDWFSLREPLDLPDNVWELLVASGQLHQSEVNAAFKNGSFLPLFVSLHQNEDYWPLVRPYVGYLRGHRGDVPGYGEKIFYAPNREIAICFIDGCKSWHGTKHWFREVAPRLRPNADILFQDFGHYTCFWLPMLVGLFRERFDLQAYVDYTYVWRLTKGITEAEVETLFPDEPTCLGKEVYEEVLGGFHREAQARGDRRGVLLSQMQLAAAYAYLGLLDESREILNALLMQSEWLPLRPYLKAARISPTYTPEKRIEL